MDIGQQLITLGWSQSCLVPTTSLQKESIVLPANQSAELEGSFPLGEIGDSEYLIVISQDCDIGKPVPSEPYVEALPAFWTSDRNIISNANRNAIRYFLLRRRTLEGEGEEGLVADAAIHLYLKKAHLLGVTPETCFSENDADALPTFRVWLTVRYNRPAIPGHLVTALQKPVVDAIKRLDPSEQVRVILDRIREVRYVAHSDTVPYRIELILMREEGTGSHSVSPEDVSCLASWIADMLKNTGRAELTDCDIYDTSNISVRDYMFAIQLPLDQYTLSEVTRTRKPSESTTR